MELSIPELQIIEYSSIVYAIMMILDNMKSTFIVDQICFNWIHCTNTSCQSGCMRLHIARQRGVMSATHACIDWGLIH